MTELMLSLKLLSVKFFDDELWKYQEMNFFSGEEKSINFT